MSTADETTRRSPVATASAGTTSAGSAPAGPFTKAGGGASAAGAKAAQQAKRAATGLTSKVRPAERTGPPVAEAQRTAEATVGAPRPAPGSPRKVKLSVARVDPWSVMKLAFLLSVAIGIATVVAAAALWTVVDGMGVFSQVNSMLTEILGSSTFDLFDYVGFARIVSLATVVAVINVVLLTAISTLAAFLYNIASSLVGGLRLTLTDD